jgi:competence protein ComEC
LRYDATQARLDAGGVSRFNDGAPVTMRAVVIDEPVERRGAQRFRVEAREVSGFAGWRPASGRVLVRAPLYPRIAYGETLELTGVLKTPPVLDSFDYRAYLLRQGVLSVMDFPRISAHGFGDADPLMMRLVGVRDALSAGIERTLPEPEAALAEGLLLGRRAALPLDLTNAFDATGTSHLIAISGYNVSLVAALVVGALAWAVGRRQAGVVALVVIGGYAALTGGSPPVVRAAVMGGLYVVAGLFGRPASAGAAVAAAAAGMTGAEPSLIHDVSFHLSFAAAAGVSWLAMPLERRLWIAWSRTLPPWPALRALVVEPAAVTVAAVTATLPLTAWHFDRFSLVALPANVVVLPLFPMTLVASLLAACAGLAGLSGPAPVALTWLPLRAMTLAVETFARVPGASVGVGGFGRWHAAAALAVVAVAAWRFASANPAEPAGDERLGLGALVGRAIVGQAGRPPAPWASAGLGLGALLWGALWLAPGGEPRLHVMILNVGQGDAIFIETPSGTQALIDGGPDSAVLQELGRVMGPLDRDIDLLALTHPQVDHQAGLIGVLERYKVGLILVGLLQGTTGADRVWRAAVRREGAEVRALRAPASVDLGDGVFLELLWPEAQAGIDDLNNGSLVFRLRYEEVMVLLTGDIEAEAEAALLQSGAGLQADVVKVAHHGSASSTTQAFLDAVRPRIAVISAGEGNRFGHPSPDVVARLELAGALVYRTDEHGRVVIETNGERLWVR